MTEATELPARSRGTRRPARNWALYGFLVLLALAPLPLGSNRPWAAAILAIGIALMLAGMGIGIAAGRFPALRLHPVLVAVALCWLAAFGWAVAQLILPPAAGGALQELWLAAPVGGMVPRLTLDTDQGMSALMQMTCTGCAFLLALLAGRSDSGARAIIRVIALSAVAYALFAIANHFLTGSMQILGYRPDPRVPGVFELRGTFVYRNAYGAAAGFGALCIVALLMRRILKVARYEAKISLWRLLAQERSGNLLLVLALFLLLGTVFASASRGALVSVLAGIGVMVVCFARAAGQGSARTAVRAVGWIALGAITLGLAASPLLQRLSELNVGAESRLLIWRTAIEALGAQPWTGWGLGTFRRVQPMFQQVGDRFNPLEAHSTLLESLVDLGLVFGTLYILPAVILGLTFAYACIRGRRMHYAALGVGAGLLALVQAAVDFTLQMPAISVWYATICGVCLAQVAFRPERARRTPE